jgi:hypothetical protein
MLLRMYVCIYICTRYGKFAMHFLRRPAARRLRSLCTAVGWSKYPRGIFQACGPAAEDGYGMAMGQLSTYRID